MKKIVASISMIFIILNLHSQNQRIMHLKSFIINGEEQKLDNNYAICFLPENENEKVIYVPTIKNDTFYYTPPMPRDTIRYHWLLKYEKKVYYLRTGRLYSFQDVEIVIETKSYKEYNDDKWRYKCSSGFDDNWDNNYGVVYVLRDSYAITCNPIMGNMKSYFRKGKELLRISKSKEKRKK